MRRYLFLVAVLCIFIISANAQVTVGLKAGTSPSITPGMNYTIGNRATPREEFTFNVTSVNSGLYLGGFLQIDIDQNFFLRGEALYNRQETDYLLNYTFDSRFRSSNEIIYTERVHRLDVPVSMGANLGPVEVFSGLLTRILIQNENEMQELDDYSESINSIQFGLQSGIGFNIMNVNIGMTYQIDFQNYGAHILIDNESLDLQNSPSRFVATLGYRF